MAVVEKLFVVLNLSFGSCWGLEIIIDSDFG